MQSSGEVVQVMLHATATDADVRLEKSSISVGNAFISQSSEESITIMNSSDVIVHYQWKSLATRQEEDQQKSRFTILLISRSTVVTKYFVLARHLYGCFIWLSFL